MRIIAMLQVYNEERFVAGCIEHLRGQGIDVFVIDNWSTDRTLEIVEGYLGHGVIGIELMPRDGSFALRAQCHRQEQLAATLDADWLIHHDADEIRASPVRGQTLAEAIAEADGAGYNAINFIEFAFVPTREAPDHDHPRFRETMRHYYPYVPFKAHRINAWKRQDHAVDLTHSGGHRVRFEGLNLSPRSLYMRHYLYISVEHALDKFVRRQFAADEVADGWFGWRARLTPEMIELPAQAELRLFRGDHLLDQSAPRKRHLLEDVWERMRREASSQDAIRTPWTEEQT